MTSRRLIIAGLVIAGLTLSTLAMYAPAAEKEKAAEEKAAPSGKQVTMTGRLSCTFCTLAHPDMTCKPECCSDCVKAGDPPLLKDADGNLFILLTGESKVKFMTKERMKLIGEQVTVKGLLVKGKGIQAIYVDSMEKIEPAASEKK